MEERRLKSILAHLLPTADGGVRSVDCKGLIAGGDRVKCVDQEMGIMNVSKRSLSGAGDAIGASNFRKGGNDGEFKEGDNQTRTGLEAIEDHGMPDGKVHVKHATDVWMYSSCREKIDSKGCGLKLRQRRNTRDDCVPISAELRNHENTEQNCSAVTAEFPGLCISPTNDLTMKICSGTAGSKDMERSRLSENHHEFKLGTEGTHENGNMCGLRDVQKNNLDSGLIIESGQNQNQVYDEEAQKVDSLDFRGGKIWRSKNSFIDMINGTFRVKPYTDDMKHNAKSSGMESVVGEEGTGVVHGHAKDAVVGERPTKITSIAVTTDHCVSMVGGIFKKPSGVVEQASHAMPSSSFKTVAFASNRHELGVWNDNATFLQVNGNCALTKSWTFAEDCVFCHICQGRAPAFKLYEDEICICILDTQPLSHGHSLIIPKAHFPSLELTPPQVAAAMCATVPTISNAIMEATSCESFNLLVNSGIAAGQVIFHTHFHIIPRRLGDNLWRSENACRRPLIVDNEMTVLVQQIRCKLSGIPVSQ